MHPRMPPLLFILFCMLSMAYAKAQPQDTESQKLAVVRIHNTQSGENGAGFIVKVDGNHLYILTAAHVVQGEQRPQVFLYNRQHEPLLATPLDIEPDGVKGLALLLLRLNTPMPNLTALTIGASSKVAGESVKVIGFPGTDFWSVEPAGVKRIEGRNLVLSGSITGGNSGGPVILNGQAIGVVTDVVKDDARTDSYATRAEVIAPYINGIVPNLLDITVPAEKIDPTTPFVIYFAAIEKRRLFITSFSFPFRDIEQNKEPGKFIKLISTLAEQYLPNDSKNISWRIFRKKDEQVVDSLNGDPVSGTNLSVVVVPSKIIDEWGGNHLVFTYINSIIDADVLGGIKTGRRMIATPDWVELEPIRFLTLEAIKVLHNGNKRGSGTWTFKVYINDDETPIFYLSKANYTNGRTVNPTKHQSPKPVTACRHEEDVFVLRVLGTRMRGGGEAFGKVQVKCTSTGSIEPLAVQVPSDPEGKGAFDFYFSLAAK